MKTIQILSLAAGVAILSGCSSYRESMGESKELSFDQLPPAAQQTVRQEIGTRQITKIDEGTKNGEMAYRVQVENEPGGIHWSKPSLWVSPSGAILKESKRLSNRGNVNEPAGAQPAQPDQQPPVAPMPSTRSDPDYQ